MRMRLLSSTFLLLVAMLLIADVCCAVCIPRPSLDEQSIAHSPAAKLTRILAAPDDADVLLLGSSLVQVSSVRVDDEHVYHRKSRFDGPYYKYHINQYCRSKYLESLLGERLGKPVEVCNAAVSACVNSDLLLFARKYLAINKKPKVAVICVAPREFLDRQRFPIDKTPTYLALGDQQSSAPQQFEHGLGGVWNLFRLHNEIKDRLQFVACSTTNRAPTLEDAKWPKVFEQPPNKLYDLTGYKSMYLPINEQQWQIQTKAFRDLLVLLKSHDIEVLVVNTPVTRENYALLPAPVLSRFRKMIEFETAVAGVPLLQPTASDFDTALDFEDSAHMNARGGTKLYSTIADAVVSDSRLAAALSAPKTLAQSSLSAVR
jgi:hypothetical protein